MNERAGLLFLLEGSNGIRPIVFFYSKRAGELDLAPVFRTFEFVQESFSKNMFFVLSKSRRQRLP